VQKFAFQPGMRQRYFIAVFAGLFFWVTGFPPAEPGIAGFAWIAPGLILMSAVGSSHRAAFRLGYAAGLGHYLFSLHWLLFMPFPLGAIAGWLALSAYLALYPAAWVWLCWRIFPPVVAHSVDRTGSRDPPIAAQASGVSAGTTWWQRARWPFLCAAVWVALEMIVARCLTGFPWNFLGVSQYQVLPLIQIARVTGVYGVSFLVVWFSVALASIVLSLSRQSRRRWVQVGELLLPLAAVMAAVIFGFSRLDEIEKPARELKVAFVQPSIPQELIWDPKENPMRFRKLMRLSEQALAGKPDLLIWPEAAMPSFDEEMVRAITNLVQSHKVWMIFGADDVDVRLDESGKSTRVFFNAAFLLNPEGELAARYRKRRLVIFGEYVPLERWLPFLKYLTPIGGSFAAGKDPVEFELTKPQARTSALICFEDTFPHLVREHVKPGTDFLVNLTNDGWFGERDEQWQHAANAAFRAVENGVPLVRCANNGLTCWIDPQGRLHEVYFPGSNDIYRAGFKTGRIPLLDAVQKQRRTFYARYGDWFGWACVALTGAAYLGGADVFRKRSKTKKT
jgi:apolipoprotein N-acyltransferase